MVQYIHTPWRDRAELLRVRQQFYPSPPAGAPTNTAEDEAEQRHAVSRVSMWMQRGGCPHLVESTALLVAAILSDLHDTRTGASSSSYAIRAAYSAAFSRYFGIGVLRPKVSPLPPSSALVQVQKSQCSVSAPPDTAGDLVASPDSFSSFASATAYTCQKMGLCPRRLGIGGEQAQCRGGGRAKIGCRTKGLPTPSQAVLMQYQDPTYGKRFVTGLLDSQQDKQRKMSMYAVAKTIGLPATFVELRHQATHEQLPSLLKLRAAAKKALVWIWHYYWKNLPGDESSTTEDKADACRNLLIQYLTEEEQSTSKKSLQKRLRKWDQTLILQVLGGIGESSEDSKLLLRSLQLSRGILDGSFTTSPAARADGSQPRSAKDIEAIRADLEKSRDELEATPVGVRDKPLQPQSRTSLETRGTGKSDNYAYLLVDDQSKDAVIIDPANPEEVSPVLKQAISAGKINLKAIVNTHHHWDHAGGNKKLRNDLGTPDLPIIGGKDCEAVTKTPADGEGFNVGNIAVKGIHTPCHTQDSICWFAQDGNEKAVFTGDTLFHGGCGRFFEGTAEEMHTALNEKLTALPDDTKVYPGHEYTKSNVKFGISVLQSEAVKKLQAFAENNKETQGQFTIGDEKQHNVFMRVEDPEIQKATGKTDAVEVMAKLREMKNNFK
ncbi:hypothetical protein DL770_011879 [Monosporascus sp. CRB-9-2]|nr:hypothetical protein DL770_011879 [Monosporascus sp. CRB-9-2]